MVLVQAVGWAQVSSMFIPFGAQDEGHKLSGQAPLMASHWNSKTSTLYKHIYILYLYLHYIYSYFIGQNKSCDRTYHHRGGVIAQ